MSVNHLIKNYHLSPVPTFPSTIVGFLRGGGSRGGGNWGTLRIPREDWGTLGKIRGITTLPLQNPIKLFVSLYPRKPSTVEPTRRPIGFSKEPRVNTNANGQVRQALGGRVPVSCGCGMCGE